ncbi:MAG: hypothetical protein HY986_13350 [Candidatus Melainabacteria bacterium]|nr:hypothetical protein [Candidatus Melainabacteria bacterium]
MFLKTHFPQLWFAAQGTFSRLALLKAQLSFAQAPALSREADLTEAQLNEELANLAPYADFFSESLSLKAPNGGALCILAQRIAALERLESRFPAETAAAHTRFDIQKAWMDLEPEEADLRYMELLLERLELALLKAQVRGKQEIGEVILAVKAVLDEFLNRYRQSEIPELLLQALH